MKRKLLKARLCLKRLLKEITRDKILQHNKQVLKQQHNHQYSSVSEYGDEAYSFEELLQQEIIPQDLND